MYNIVKGDINDYIKKYGEYSSFSLQGLDIKDNKCTYYMIKKNRKDYSDFCLYNDTGYLDINKNNIINNKIFSLVKRVIRGEIYIVEPSEINIDNVLSKLDNYKIEDIKQGPWLYKKIIIKM